MAWIPTPLGPIPWGECTTRGDTLFLHVFQWPADGRLVVPGSFYLDVEYTCPAEDDYSEWRVRCGETDLTFPLIDTGERPTRAAFGGALPRLRTYRVGVRLATARGDKRLFFTLRLMEGSRESRLVFNPLLTRFIYGEDFRARAVKISDSGRIRNELQTLCSEAIEYLDQQQMRIHFDRIPPEVISPEHQQMLLEVLRWYKRHHPLWFSWLQVEGPAGKA